MAATKSPSKSARSRAAKPETTVTPANAPAPEPQLSDAQQETANATSATSKVEPGEALKVDDFRVETEGVKNPIKSDFDNPESPMMYDPAGTMVGPAKPGPVKIGVGETLAQHEAHVLLNGAEVIAERLEAEAGPDGVSADIIAREQQARAAGAEFQRVDGDQAADRSGDNLNKASEGRLAASEA